MAHEDVGSLQQQLLHLREEQEKLQKLVSFALDKVDRLASERRLSFSDAMATINFREHLETLADLQDKNYQSRLESYEFLACFSLGLPTDQIKLLRVVPIRAYLDISDTPTVSEFWHALNEALDSVGLHVDVGYPEVIGSWFKKWFARSAEAMTQPEVIERLKKIERAVELKGIDKPQSEVDENQSNAIARLIKSLDKVPNAAIQAGSVLVIKLSTQSGPMIQARTLTQQELIELETNQMLLQHPAEVLDRLESACKARRHSSRQIPANEA